MVVDRPLFTNPSAFQGSVPSGRVSNPSVVPAALSNLAGAFQGLGEVMWKADIADRLLKAQLLIAEEFSALERTFDRETNVKGAAERFDQAAQEIKNRAMAFADDEGFTTGRIDAIYRKAMLPASANVYREVFKREVAAHQVGVVKLRNQLLAVGALNPDPEMTDQIDAYDEQLDSSVGAGFLREEDKEAERAQFRADLVYQRARMVVASDPVRAYDLLTEMTTEGGKQVPVHFRGMDGNARGNLMVSALASMASAERRVSKEVRDRQDAAAGKMWSIHLDPEQELTADVLEANKDSLDIAAFKELIRVVKAEPALRNDPEAENRIWGELYRPGASMHGVRNYALRLHADGLITGPTLSAVLGRAEERSRQSSAGGPDSAHDRAMSHLNTRMRSIQILAAGDLGANIRLSDARADLDVFFDQNPNATAEQGREEADRLSRRYALIDLTDKTISWPRPWGGPLAADAQTVAIIDERIRALAREHQAGRVDADVYDAELANLFRWREAIAIKAEGEGEGTSGPRRSRPTP